MKKRHILNISLLGAAILLFGISCASKPPVLYRDEKPLSITDYEKVAQKEFDEQRYKYAISAYEAIIENYSDNKNALAWAHYEIGYCYYTMKEYDKSEQYFRKVINEYQEPAAKKLAQEMLDKILEK